MATLAFLHRSIASSAASDLIIASTPEAATLNPQQHRTHIIISIEFTAAAAAASNHISSSSIESASAAASSNHLRSSSSIASHQQQ
jgi:hypothetical protein